MAIFTTADRDAVKSAIVTAAVNGYASVSVGGQSVSMKSLQELKDLLQVIQADLASADSHFGLRFTKLVPGEGGC